jgi:hypothetical protein
MKDMVVLTSIKINISASRNNTHWNAHNMKTKCQEIHINITDVICDWVAEQYITHSWFTCILISLGY